MKKELEYRVAKAKATIIPENSLDRSRLLKSLQVTLHKLRRRRSELRSIITDANHELAETKLSMGRINKQIKELKPDDGFIVTEHALLRYLERFHDINLEQIHQEILDLEDDDKVMANNTVITVFPTADDHFNLAENEDKA